MKIAILLACAAAASAQMFPISGTVVDARSGSAMSKVRITLTPAARPNEQRNVITGPDGKFSFDVPKGKFGIVAEYRGLRQPFGQYSPGVGFGVAIFTGPDQDASQLIFKWFPYGAISGKVTDDHDEPVENALVQLIRASVTGGRMTRATAAWARTNDLGEYRFGERAGGTYYLAVTGTPWYTSRTQRVRLPGLGDDNAPEEPSEAYAPVYYPNAGEPSGARPLELAAGAEARADFRLSSIGGVNVRVHCPLPKGKAALISLVTDGAAAVDAYQRQEWMYSDDQIVTGVFPGHYMLRVEGRNGYTDSARTAIDVGASDVTVELAMQPATRVHGSVVFKDPARRPRRAVTVRLIDESTNGARAAAMSASGEFSIENLAPGKRRVQIVNADGFFVAGVAAEGATVNGPMIDVAPGSDIKLTITATDDVGTLKGFVRNGDRPLAGVLVVLAPVKESNDPGDYRGFETDSDGSFDYLNVRAGDYILFATERLDLEYARAEAVRPYLRSGKRVTIAAHGSLTEDAPPVAPGN
jgi:Carboxypeptidase regulatory-like domain